MIELENVTLNLSSTKFHFDLQVPQSSCIAVIGPSGAGKSTLLSLIAGFSHPLSGTIRFAGNDLTKTPAAKRPVSTVFQAHNLFEHLSVSANIGLGINPGLKLTATDQERIMQALEKVGLGKYAQRMPSELSGGERQRVALARALVRKRPYLLLDEPFAALGPAQRMKMLALLNELRHDEKLTVVLVSHHPSDAQFGAEYTAFLCEGRVLVTDKTDALFSRQDIPALQNYLGTTESESKTKR